MQERVQWLGRMPWQQDNEPDVLDWSVQPPYSGLLKGDYYHAENNFQGRWGDKGHLGSLDVVVDGGKIVFAEFNEQTMANYYVRYFQRMSKRRSEYGFFQDFHDKRRSVAHHKVAAAGYKFVEDQILAKQDLGAEFDLLAGASFSAGSMVGMTKVIDAQMKDPAFKPQKYYGWAEDLGSGITGWLQVAVQDGKIVKCFYDEILADHSDAITYDDLKQFYRLSKYHSQIFEEPFPDGWDREAWLVDFKTLSDQLNERVCETQNLLDIGGLPCVEGPDLGFVWDKPGRTDGEQLVSNVDACAPIERPRHPVWNNYLNIAARVQAEMQKDGILKQE